jgi:hypothetical protein
MAHEDGIYQVWGKVEKSKMKGQSGRAIITVCYSLPFKNTPYTGLYSNFVKELIRSTQNSSSGHLVY